MIINNTRKYNINFRNVDNLGFAAKELQAYCQKVFNTEFELLSNSDAIKSEFNLGLLTDPEVVAKLSKHGVDIAAFQDTEKENYIILVTDEDVCFYGDRPRSVLYAVYDFLKDELGCEFAISVDDFEYIPQLQNIDLQISKRVETAAFAVRGLGFHTDDYVNIDLYSKMIDWLTKLKYNRIQFNIRLWDKLSDKLGPMIEDRDLDLDLGVHSLGFFLSPDDYFEKHPEWYVDIDNRFGRQLKFSNLDSVHTATANIIDYLKKTPNVKYLGLWPLDGTAFDPDDIASGKMGDIVLAYVNSVAEEITKVFPDLIFDHLAYVGYVAPPKETVPNSEVMTSVCHYWDRNFTQPIYDSWYGKKNNASEISQEKAANNFSPLRSQRECCEDLCGWIDIGDTIVFTYYSDLNLSAHNVFDIWNVIQQDMQYYHAVGAKGSLACYCMHEEYVWIYREIHAMAAFQWNPYASSAEINRKLLKTVFAEAGDEIAKFYKSLDALHNKPLFAGFHTADLHRGIIPTYNLSGYNIKLHNLVLEQFDNRWNKSVACLDNAMRIAGSSKKIKEYIDELKFNMIMQKAFVHLGCHVLCAFSYRELSANGKINPEQANKMALEMCDKALQIFNSFMEQNNERIALSKGLIKKMQAYKSALEQDFPTMLPPF